MYISIGFLGHVLTLSFGPEEDSAEHLEELRGIGGGSGGIFERFVDVEPEEYWEEEDRHTFGFG